MDSGCGSSHANATEEVHEGGLPELLQDVARIKESVFGGCFEDE